MFTRRLFTHQLQSNSIDCIICTSAYIIYSGWSGYIHVIDRESHCVYNIKMDKDSEIILCAPVHQYHQYFAAICDDKLQIYSLQNMQKVREITMYNHIGYLACTNEFIVCLSTNALVVLLWSGDIYKSIELPCQYVRDLYVTQSTIAYSTLRTMYILDLATLKIQHQIDSSDFAIYLYGGWNGVMLFRLHPSILITYNIHDSSEEYIDMKFNLRHYDVITHDHQYIMSNSKILNCMTRRVCYGYDTDFAGFFAGSVLCIHNDDVLFVNEQETEIIIKPFPFACPTVLLYTFLNDYGLPRNTQ